MRTLMLVALLTAAAGCGDDGDASTSAACKQSRQQYALAKLMRDRAASLGAPVLETDAALAKFQSDHWECFH